MRIGVGFFQIFVALACFSILKKFSDSVGLNVPIGLLLLAALIVLVVLQVRWEKSQRLSLATQRDAPRQRRQAASLRLAIGLAALAMAVFVALVIWIVPSSDLSARETFLSVGFPGWTCLVAMKIYGAYLSEQSAASRGKPLLALWLVQAFVIFVAPGLMDTLLHAGSTFYLNTQPIAVAVLAGAGFTYYLLSRP
jgi:hypothetical protein